MPIIRYLKWVEGVVKASGSPSRMAGLSHSSLVGTPAYPLRGIG